MPTNSEIAREFFDALERGDAAAVAELCSGDCTMSENRGHVIGIETLMAFAANIRRAIPDQRYVNVVTQETADGFVEEHDFTGTLPDGTCLSASVCVVGTVRDGKVTGLREYIDSKATEKLFRFLMEPVSTKG